MKIIDTIDPSYAPHAKFYADLDAIGAIRYVPDPTGQNDGRRLEIIFKAGGAIQVHGEAASDIRGRVLNYWRGKEQSQMLEMGK